MDKDQDSSRDDQTSLVKSSTKPTVEAAKESTVEAVEGSTVEAAEGSTVEAAEGSTVEASVESSVYQYHGPIPHPDHLEKYEQIAPGYADRIMTMAEKEQQHRLEKEKGFLMATVSIETRGQILATLLGIIGFLVALAFAFLDYPKTGAILVICVISSILSALYVRHKSDQKSDNEE